MRPAYCHRVLNRRIVLFLTAALPAAALWLLSLTVQAQNSARVDLALVLAVDCSHSVSNDEFNLQMGGLAKAFADREVIEAIESGIEGRIAVTLVEWSGLDAQEVALPWMIVSDEFTALRVSRAISDAKRLVEGKTSISAVIDFAMHRLAASPAPAHRYVLDISGDGVSNIGEPVKLVRDRAVAAGITINGLAILNNVANLDRYFKNSVAGGAGHFVMKADDYAAYGVAIKRKLLREIRGLPVS